MEKLKLKIYEASAEHVQGMNAHTEPQGNAIHLITAHAIDGYSAKEV